MELSRPDTMTNPSLLTLEALLIRERLGEPKKFEFELNESDSTSGRVSLEAA